jgi:hypothetical protein
MLHLHFDHANVVIEGLAAGELADIGQDARENDSVIL